ncbi:MAG: enoyl-CoA hydratase [Elusimicrobia bacterium CG11_big_fil_rev_8_21_14_0_20_64_6]|nr:MAG: enoyl-CoA hydratase [Elusimicrobia bacterium CG11_big_fil_rev_8_21_14_0_20_64_6]
MSLVSLRTERSVTTLRLERPQALNAMSETMAREFAAAVRRAAGEKSKVVVLEAAGTAFSAGGDLAFIEANMKRPKGSLAKIMRRFYGDFLSIRALPQVTIAKIHGTAIGAGLCLALACDLRVVVDDAKLGFNFVRLGLNPGMAAWPLARMALGDARARDLLFTSRLFSGRELHLWGGACASALTPGGLDVVCAELAGRIASGSAASLRILKAETRLGDDLIAFLIHEAKGQAMMFKGPDIAEGVAAIRQRRAPKF